MVNVNDVRKGGTYKDIDKAILHEIPLPPAGDRTRWYGIQHGELIDKIAEGVGNAGLSYDKDTWTLSGKGERLFGYIDVTLSEEEFEWTKEALDLPDEIEYQDFAFDQLDLRMGLRHSNDSTVALYLMVIPRIKQWGNAITVEGGNISLHRRHTKSIGDDDEGLDEAVKQGVKTFLLKAALMDQEIKTLKALKLSDPEAHHVMIVAASKKIVPWSSLGRVKTIWAEEEGDNAWDLYMAFTRVGMLGHIHREMSMVSRTRKLILELCDEAQIEDMVTDTVQVEHLEDDMVPEGEYHAATIDLEPGDKVAVAKVPVMTVPEEVVHKDWDLADVF
jgi:hypothetical protein